MGLLADLTATMSAVGRERPELVQDRQVCIFIELTIAEAKKREARTVSERAPPALIDTLDV